MSRMDVRFSDALNFLMHQQRAVLEANRGNPPQGKCVDCKKDVPAHEIAVKCDKCENEFICVRCVDRHDHLHSVLAQMGFLQLPN
jgi:Zn finger protein HypA/HybF involved in hydrogenase expression